MCVADMHDAVAAGRDPVLRLILMVQLEAGKGLQEPGCQRIPGMRGSAGSENAGGHVTT